MAASLIEPQHQRPAPATGTGSGSGLDSESAFHWQAHTAGSGESLQVGGIGNNHNHHQSNQLFYFGSDRHKNYTDGKL